MKIKKLKIINYKAIENFCIDNLRSTVVIAGPNGCGKSCIFEAIRLLKTTYGTYVARENQSLQEEFQIGNGKDKNLDKLKRDRDKKTVVEVIFDFSEEELIEIKASFDDTMPDDIMQELQPKQFDDNAVSLSIPAHLKEVYEKRLSSRREAFLKDANNKNFTARIEIDEPKSITHNDNHFISFIFSHWLPERLGVIYYTSAERSFKKSRVGSININRVNARDQAANHALYSTDNRFANFQSHLATHTVYASLAETLDRPDTDNQYFETSLKDLFEKFVPGKRYLGAKLDRTGTLDFIVETSDGRRHSINELSSGEKQILFSYVELYNSAPRKSILMMDEPEIHLNPKLVRSLPEFYDSHLGKHFENQILIITHSDALLREASRAEHFSVFHMQHSDEEKNQAKLIGSELESSEAVNELVGDLSQLVDNKPIVFIEGESNEFDKEVIEAFFPEIASKVNLISSGNKSSAVNSCKKLREIPGLSLGTDKIFSITDKDNYKPKAGPIEFTWKRFHIENFLLDEEAIFSVLCDVANPSERPGSIDEVLEALKGLAKEEIIRQANEYVIETINSRIISKFSLSSDPRSETAYESIEQKLESSISSMSDTASSIISDHEARSLFDAKRAELEESLSDGRWKSEIRGREILRNYLKRIDGISYPRLTTMVINKIIKLKREPQDMKDILELILR